MTQSWPRAWGALPGRTRLRVHPEDFQVSEELGFAPSGVGEHCYLYLQKRGLNSADVVKRLSALSDVSPRDIGFCGMKDRNAVTRQWFSVCLAGRREPDWRLLEADGQVRVLGVDRHSRKLRRGVHRGNRFRLILRDLSGDRSHLEQRLQALRGAGVPNYFGAQRFGSGGSTLAQARRWMRGGRRISRERRALYLSALRACLFNQVLGARVASGTWNTVLPGDVCMLRGTRSFFVCEGPDESILARVADGDIHPGVPLWGSSRDDAATVAVAFARDVLRSCDGVCAFLEDNGLELAWRPARLIPGDFCWQFCDDGALQLELSLSAGSYATALLSEFVRCEEGSIQSDIGSEQD